jgi:hypothetical protein
VAGRACNVAAAGLRAPQREALHVRGQQIAGAALELIWCELAVLGLDLGREAPKETGLAVEGVALAVNRAGVRPARVRCKARS